MIKENSVNLVLKQEYNLGDFKYGKGPDLGNEELMDVKEAMMDNNVKYRGQMIKNTVIRHGKGKQTWKDGSVYEGWWRYDKAYGPGRLIHADGDFYIGQWENDKAQGYG